VKKATDNYSAPVVYGPEQEKDREGGDNRDVDSGVFPARHKFRLFHGVADGGA
jgi:hypothetical protein